MSSTIEIKKRVTAVAIEDMQAPIVNGVKMCLNGCGQPVPDCNEKYCSLKCANEFYAKHNQAGLRKYVFEREKGKCQHCGYQQPVFSVPFPAKPVMPTFSKPRPEETDFPNYAKSSHRIGHFKNQLIRASEEQLCSCGAVIKEGDYCYCQLPDALELDCVHVRYLKRNGIEYESHCWSGCQKRDPQDTRRFDRIFIDKKAVHSCEPLGVHCVACGLKEIKAIEKQWRSDHRKALAAFKAAYRAWDAEYTFWAKEVLPAFRERERQYFEACKQWEASHDAWLKTVEFRTFTADHIVPIALGGDEFDLNNIQLLCEVCDKKKTAKDLAKIAKLRKRIKDFHPNQRCLA
ncbi:MAG: HNH endonuclease [Candidatus Bathyarchaeia archaeon]